MKLQFHEAKHEYISPDNDIDWISATTLIGAFKQPFSPDQAKKSSKNKKSKWYGLTEQEVLSLWSKEAKRATDLGTWYHNQQESLLCEVNTITREGTELPVFVPTYSEGIKYAPDQKLTSGIYPEHFMYLQSSGVCGQSDRAEVIYDVVHIRDYKTNKEIKTKGYANWEGITQKMLPPLQHLEDCHINHYALQLSLYMYMILKHNPRLKPGTLAIEHIRFKEAGRDQYDYPITFLDNQGNPVVEEVIIYELPYLKSEIISLLAYLKDNRSKIKKK